MKFLPIILRNLLRSPRRLLLPVLSIGISTFLFATLMSLPSAFNGLLHDQVCASARDSWEHVPAAPETRLAESRQRGLRQ
jgi:hypothetical protein